MSHRLWDRLRPLTCAEQQNIEFDQCRRELGRIEAWRLPIKLQEIFMHRADPHKAELAEREEALEWLAAEGKELGFSALAAVWRQHGFTVSDRRSLQTFAAAQPRCRHLRHLALEGMELDTDVLMSLLSLRDGTSLNVADCFVDRSFDAERWRTLIDRRRGGAWTRLAVLQRGAAQRSLVQVATILSGAAPLHRLKLRLKHDAAEVRVLLRALASQGTVAVLEMSLLDAHSVRALVTGLLEHGRSIPVAKLVIHCAWSERRLGMASLLAELIGNSPVLTSLKLDMPIGPMGLAMLFCAAQGRPGFLLDCPVPLRLRGEKARQHAGMQLRLRELREDRAGQALSTVESI